MADEYTVKMPCFDGQREDHNSLWWLIFRAAVRRKKILYAVTEDDVSTDIADEALSLVISAPSSNMLRALQSHTTARDGWAKLRIRYAGRALTNKIGALNRLLDFKFKIQQQISGYEAKLHSSFPRIPSMHDSVLDSMQLPISVSALYNSPKYCAINTPVNTKVKEKQLQTTY